MGLSRYELLTEAFRPLRPPSFHRMCSCSELKQDVYKPVWACGKIQVFELKEKHAGQIYWSLERSLKGFPTSYNKPQLLEEIRKEVRLTLRWALRKEQQLQNNGVQQAIFVWFQSLLRPSESQYSWSCLLLPKVESFHSRNSPFLLNHLHATLVFHLPVAS